jgi:hypothetical protein
MVKKNLVLHYDAEENVMRDMNEYIIFNIFKYITPNDLFMFKKNKQNMITYGRSGEKVTLLYLD